MLEYLAERLGYGLAQMQQSTARRGVRVNPIWALAWAVIVFAIFIVVMLWATSR